MLSISSFPSARIPRKGQHVARQAAGANSVPVEPRNASQWHQVAEFLDAQWLASFGCRMLPRVAAAATGNALALPKAPQLRSIPHGNHGDNNSLTSCGAVGALAL